MTEYNEKIEQIKDIINNYGLDTLIGCCSCLDGDNAIYPMDDFDDVLDGFEPWEIARAAYYGEFCPTNDYFRLNVYGNLESTNNPYNEGWVDLDELARYAVDNDEDFGTSEIRELLDQWEAKEENDEEEE